MPRETSAEIQAVSIDSPADQAALKLCTLCFPSVNHTSPFMICCHMIDPENRLFYHLTAMKKWSHDQAREAIQAYGEFMTLKIARKDYDALVLSPTSVIDEVWHAHVLDTKSYQSFNARYMGAGHLIHHDPLKAMDDKGRQHRCKTTIQAYGSYFRRPVPEKCNSWSYEPSVLDKSDLSQVFVKGLEGKTYTFYLNLTKNGDTVDDESSVLDKSDLSQLFIKGLVGTMYTIEVNLTENGDTVDDESSVLDKSDLSQLFIKGLDGTMYTIEVNLTENGDTVEDLKRKVTAICDVPEDEQRLIYAGRQLEDGRFLNDYHLSHESTLHLVKRLRGC
jgi:hypothetical protein